MNKYNGLLSGVAQQYGIPKGKNESELDWKIRIVYSICGMMAYASLWDDAEDDPISITHLKRKAGDMLGNYTLMYPELVGSLPYKAVEFEDEIINLFLSTGIVYHRPNRIAPAMHSEKVFGKIDFQRGIPIDGISCVSGIGFYSIKSDSSVRDDVRLMFGLERESLKSLWSNTLTAANWTKSTTFDQSTEYLRIKPPYSQGYWTSNPDISGQVSILRTGLKGSQLYYLYHNVDAGMEVSPCPQWQVESYNYRTLASACLSSLGTLPPIECSEDGMLIHIKLNYLLPPRELNFLKLYSWPEVCSSLPCDFRRKLSKEVFIVIKSILSECGYEFSEVKFNA